METGRTLTADEIVSLFYSAITFVVLVSLWFAWPTIGPKLSPLWRIMSRLLGALPGLDQLTVGDTAPENNNRNNDDNLIAMLQNERNQLLLVAKAQALAALVHAKKIGQTEGIKLVFGVSPSSSNKVYLAARDALQAELSRLENLDIETPEAAESRLRAMVAASRKE